MRKITCTTNYIDFAKADINKNVEYLFERAGERKGISPLFEGFDVFPNGTKTEIILRWKYSGSGQQRMIQKYMYDGSKISLIDQADFLGNDSGDMWIKSLE